MPKPRKGRRRGLLLLLAGALLFGVGLLCGFLLRGGEVSFWKNLVLTPEPAACAVCGDGDPYHAPCLLNLSTGQLGELRIYAPSPTQAGALAAEQQRGYLTFHRCAGLTAVIDGEAQTCTLTVPPSKAPLDPGPFCRACRAMLAEAAKTGYALLDLYNRTHPRAYPLRTDAAYAIRDYTVFMGEDPVGDGCRVQVSAHLLEN